MSCFLIYIKIMLKKPSICDTSMETQIKSGNIYQNYNKKKDEDCSKIVLA